MPEILGGHRVPLGDMLFQISERREGRGEREYHFGSETVSNWRWGGDVMGSQLLEKVKGTVAKTFTQEPTTPAGSGSW